MKNSPQVRGYNAMAPCTVRSTGAPANHYGAWDDLALMLQYCFVGIREIWVDCVQEFKSESLGIA